MTIDFTSYKYELGRFYLSHLLVMLTFQFYSRPTCDNKS